MSDRVLQRTKYALTVLPTHDNPFLEYILTGTYKRSLPRYLQPNRFEAVRNGLDRLTLFHGSIEDAGRNHAGSGFDGFNLSDIFEYFIPKGFRPCVFRFAFSRKAGLSFRLLEYVCAARSSG